MARSSRSSRSFRGPSDEAVLVVGLGRFGSSVAQSLVQMGHEVLAVENRAERVQDWAEELTHVVHADATDEGVLQQLGAGEFPRAVVAIGRGLEASILTVTALLDLGVPDVWAKALSRPHGKILQRIGAHHVVYPEFEMGQRVAHQVTGRMIDYMAVEGGFALGETRAPADLVGRPLGQTEVRRRHRVTVVSIKRPGEDFTYATADTVVQAGDLLIVAGRAEDVERFAGIL
ncbi:MAG: TrkA family potassium uptake protein [Actinomycetota bacterium]|nr:TrkA family potassium uptake protein [Actinomycetota bacterium]